MDQTVLFVTISLMFILTLLLIGAIHSKLHWAAKAMFIVVSLAVVTIDYKAITGSLGWPVRDQLPDSLQLLSVVIDEPSRKGDNQGAIYVWYVNNDTNGKPRSVQIPYTKEMHKKMAKAQSMLDNGKKVYMSRFKNGNAGSNGDAKEGTTGGKRKGQSTFQSPGPLDFVQPPDAVQMKDQPSPIVQ